MVGWLGLTALSTQFSSYHINVFNVSKDGWFRVNNNTRW